MNYKKTIVCYFDILGFKAQITERKRTCKEIITLFNFINKSLKEKKDSIKKSNGIIIKIVICSDSVAIFSQSKNIATIKKIIECVQLLQIKLLYGFGILIRGGITIGDMCYKKSQFGFDLFGPAFQEAAVLESSLNPKISANSKIVSLLTEQDKRYMNKYLLSKENNKYHMKHFSNIHNIWTDDLIYKIALNISIESQCKTPDKCNAEGINEYRGHTKQCEENIYTNKWIYIREEFKNFCGKNGKMDIWRDGHFSNFKSQANN